MLLSAGSCTWATTTPCSSTGAGKVGWKGPQKDKGRGWRACDAMRCGACDSTGDASQWGMVMRGPAGSTAPGQPGPGVSAHAGGRLGWTRAGAETWAPGGGCSPCIEALAASALGRARCCCHQAWAQALLPPSCLVPFSCLSPAPCRSRPRSPRCRLPPCLFPSLLPSLPAPLNSFSLLQATAVTNLFVWVLQILTLKVPVVMDEPDETTPDRMQQPLGLLNQEMVWPLQEVEQLSQEKSKGQSYVVWRTLLFALQHWQLGLIAGVLLLLSVGLYWWLRKRSHEEDSSSDEESSSSEEEEQEEAEEEEEENEGEDADGERDVGSYFARRIRWSVQKLHDENPLVFLLVDSLLHTCRQLLSSSSFPVLEAAIRVDSAFEGWSPHEDDAVYRLLVPLKPPRGHAFHLEAGTVGQMLADSCIRVELVCTCTTEETVGDMLCFLHHPEEALRENLKPSLLHTLCTSSYLDVQKTALWFQDFVRSAWEFVPQSHQYSMKVLPSSRSCKLQLTHVSGRTLLVEMMLGVQQGDSDIFASSQATEAVCTPSTTWPLSFSVAEAKFFRLMAREVPHDSFHLNCLQFCTRMLMGTGFSSYAFKTIVMHLLTTMPLAGWRRTDFLLRLEDIMRYLRCCLEEKRLNHFFFGNETIPEEIILPPALQTAEPLNLLQDLAQDPAAHEQAMSEFRELQFRLRRQLFNWH